MLFELCLNNPLAFQFTKCLCIYSNANSSCLHHKEIKEMQNFNLIAPYCIRKEENFHLVFDPYPGGRVFFLSLIEGIILDDLLSGKMNPHLPSRPYSINDVIAFLNSAHPFLSFDSSCFHRIQSMHWTVPVVITELSNTIPITKILRGPLSIALLLTDECENTCPYCCIKTQKPRADIFPTQHKAMLDALQINELSQLGVVGIHLHGGEPLLIPELPGFVDTLKKAGFVVSLSTRKKRSTQYWRRMKKSGLSLLQISYDLDSITFNQFLASLSEVIESSISVVVNIVQTRSNVDKAISNSKYMEAILSTGPKEIRFEPLQPSLWRRIEDSMLPRKDSIQNLVQYAKEIDKKRIQVELPQYNFRAICEKYPAVVCIASDGYLYPCDKLAFGKNYRVSNWKRKGFLTAWKERICKEIHCPFFASGFNEKSS